MALDHATVSLRNSYENGDQYPQNLIEPDHFHRNLKAFADRLRELQDVLFDHEDNASVDVLEAEEWDKSFVEHQMRDINDVHRLWKGDRWDCSRLGGDPQYRVFFIRSPHSRARLSVSKGMLVHVLSYLQVNPSFLDFVFPFRQQTYAIDSFGGFRSQTCYDPQDRGCPIPQLGRSGVSFQQCYSLKSVEPSRGQTDWPWSIRLTSVYHSFDLENGHTEWIVVKGSNLMKNRISSHLPGAQLKSGDPVSNSLLLSFETHLILCDWTDENWRWYTNYIDEQLNEMSRPLLSIQVDPTPDPNRPTQKPTRAAFRVSEKGVNFASKGSNGATAQPSPTAIPSLLSDSKTSFKFDDIQRMAFIETNVNQAHLELAADIEVLLSIKKHYSELWGCESLPKHLQDNCKTGFRRFQSRLDSTVESLKMHRSRMDSILQLIADRKSLLNDMFSYLSIQNSQTSAKEMEDMTALTLRIAIKTEKETVAMKLITLVTLLFLPATFVSTLMSTDIVKFPVDESAPVSQQKPHRIFSLGALQLFFTICVPLMIVTLVGWALWNHIVKRRAQRRYEKWAEYPLAQNV
ncbi:MAG: hypothetical protein M1831_003237 [Alyxoria varia]|nr:MAG: hypothetical protein M1831_003237 [Alyxoria varia]